MKTVATLALAVVVGCSRPPVVPVVAGAHADPTAIVASPDGALLYVACPAQRAVAVVDVDARALVGLHDVGARPRGLAVSRDGATLAVSLPDDDAVAVLDATTFAGRVRASVGLEPAGLAFDADGRRLFVANARSGDLSVVDVARGAETLRVPTGREPYAVALSPDGRTVAVASRTCDVGRPDSQPCSELTLLDAATGAVARRVPLVSCHLAHGLAFAAGGSRVLVPVIRVRNLLPIVQVDRGWVMSTALASVDVATGAVALLPMNEICASFSDPTAIAVDPSGARAFVASATSDRVRAVRVADALPLEKDAAPEKPEHLSWTSRYVDPAFDVGAVPSGLAAAGGVLAVTERLDDSVSLFAPDGRRLARIAIVPSVPDDAVRRGDRVFHDARYAFQCAFSCSSCHPDAHTDGLTYDFEIDGIGQNVVLNRSLRGLKGTAPFKWNGHNASLAEQCGPRFAKVLTRADPFPAAQLADLVAYVESLPPPRGDPRSATVAGRDTGAAARGRAIFERATRRDGTPIDAADRCVTCHAPPHYTNGRRAGVGTGTARDASGSFDVPHLTGIGSKAPYLHDGRALTLEEIWTAPDVGDLHGAVTDLTKADLNDLVAFLKGL